MLVQFMAAVPSLAAWIDLDSLGLGGILLAPENRQWARQFPLPLPALSPPSLPSLFPPASTRLRLALLPPSPQLPLRQSKRTAKAAHRHHYHHRHLPPASPLHSLLAPTLRRSSSAGFSPVALVHCPCLALLLPPSSSLPDSRLVPARELSAIVDLFPHLAHAQPLPLVITLHPLVLAPFCLHRLYHTSCCRRLRLFP